MAATPCPTTVTLDCCDEQLCLLPERALHWPRRATLLAADLHIGKEQAFGRHGIAIPGGASEQSLELLFDLVDRLRVERLIVLGDFLHSNPRADESWRRFLSVALDQRTALDMHIVAGNHDRPAARRWVDDRVHWRVEPWIEPPFVLRHFPEPHPHGHVLAGHVHPVIHVGRARRGRVRTPVFWCRERVTVLPAFGRFTGGQAIRPSVSDQVFIVGPDCVLPLPQPRSMGSRSNV